MTKGNRPIDRKFIAERHSPETPFAQFAVSFAPTSVSSFATSATRFMRARAVGKMAACGPKVDSAPLEGGKNVDLAGRGELR